MEAREIKASVTVVEVQFIRATVVAGEELGG